MIISTPDGKSTLHHTETVKGPKELCDCYHHNLTRFGTAQERWALMRHINAYMVENGQHTMDVTLDRTFHRIQDYQVNETVNGYRYLTHTREALRNFNQERTADGREMTYDGDGYRLLPLQAGRQPDIGRPHHGTGMMPEDQTGQNPNTTEHGPSSSSTNI